MEMMCLEKVFLVAVLDFLVSFNCWTHALPGHVVSSGFDSSGYIQPYWDEPKASASGFYPATVAVGYDAGGGGDGQIGFYGGGGDRAKHIDYRQGGFNKGYQGVRQGGQDTGYLDQTNSRAKGHADLGGYNQQKQQNDRGVAQQGYGRRGGHRKGHHSTGFRNSYHKDETGEKESFWDDANDHGAQWAGKDQSAGYIQGGGQHQKAGYLDQALDARDAGRLAKQGNSRDFSQTRGGQGGFNRQGYLDDGSGYGRRYKLYNQHQHQHQLPIYKRYPVVGGYIEPIAGDYGVYPLEGGHGQDLLDDYSTYGDESIIEGPEARSDGGYVQKGGLFEENLPAPIGIGTATYVEGPPPKPVSIQYKKYIY